MKVEFALLCDHASKDAMGKLILIGVFDTLFGRTLPLRHPVMYFVCRFEAEPSEAGRPSTFEISLVDGEGRKLHELTGSLTPEKGPPGLPTHADLVLGVQDLSLPHEGAYEFIVSLAGEVQRRVPLHVRLAPK